MTSLDRSLGQLHDSVVERWGWDIASGALSSGDCIVADDAAAQFGVSRSVIREAVRVLESMGMLTVKRRVGITVLPAQHWNPFDPCVIRWRLAGPDRLRQLEHLSELRAAVEPAAAAFAATRATPVQCGALTEAVIGMSATARNADTQAYLDHDASFHRTLLQASGNPMFAGLAQVVVAVLSGRTRHALMPEVADTQAIHLHGVVAANVRSGNAAAAREAMQAIVTESTAAIHAVHEASRQ